jgi:hypothetical protein
MTLTPLFPVLRAASVRFGFVAVAALAGLLAAGEPSSAAEHGHASHAHGPHEHGVGQLSLAVEGNAVEVEITAPGADIVGFEHAAETDADRAALAAAVVRLKDAAALFRFPPKAGCRAEEVEVQSGLLGGERGHGGDAHAEFRAHYHFRCADPAALTHIDLGYFTAFPAARELEARTITARGQGAQELTADRPRLTF